MAEAFVAQAFAGAEREVARQRYYAYIQEQLADVRRLLRPSAVRTSPAEPR